LATNGENDEHAGCDETLATNGENDEHADSDESHPSEMSGGARGSPLKVAAVQNQSATSDGSAKENGLKESGVENDPDRPMMQLEEDDDDDADLRRADGSSKRSYNDGESSACKRRRGECEDPSGTTRFTDASADRDLYKLNQPIAALQEQLQQESSERQNIEGKYSQLIIQNTTMTHRISTLDKQLRHERDKNERLTDKLIEQVKQLGGAIPSNIKELLLLSTSVESFGGAAGEVFGTGASKVVCRLPHHVSEAGEEQVLAIQYVLLEVSLRFHACLPVLLTLQIFPQTFFRRVTEANKERVEKEVLHSTVLGRHSDHFVHLNGHFFFLSGEVKFHLPEEFKVKSSDEKFQGLIMEFANEGTVEHFLPAHSVRKDRATKLSLQLIHALQDARHTFNFKHGDLKPSNIFVNKLRKGVRLSLPVPAGERNAFCFDSQFILKIGDLAHSNIGPTTDKLMTAQDWTTVEFMSPGFLVTANRTKLYYGQDEYASAMIICDFFLGESLLIDLMNEVVCPEELKKDVAVFLNSSEGAAQFSVFKEMQSNLCAMEADRDDVNPDIFLDNLFRYFVLFVDVSKDLPENSPFHQSEIWQMFVLFCSDSDRNKEFLDKKDQFGFSNPQHHKMKRMCKLLGEPGRDLVQGLADLNPLTRWTYVQALMSPLFQELLLRDGED